MYSGQYSGRRVVWRERKTTATLEHSKFHCYGEVKKVLFNLGLGASMQHYKRSLPCMVRNMLRADLHEPSSLVSSVS